MAQLVERKTGDRRVASLSFTPGGVSVLCPLSKTLYLLLNTSAPQEDSSQHDKKIVDWDIKNKKKNLCARSELLHSTTTPSILMGESFRIIPEFRILRLTFHRKSASKC